MNWRPSKPSEINSFYQEEFPDYKDSMPPFVQKRHPKEYGIELEPPHPIKKNEASKRSFIRRNTATTNGERRQQLISSFEGVDDQGIHPINFIQSPAKNDPTDSGYELIDPAVLENGTNPVAKSVYASLDNWDRNRITAVDIDAKDVALDRLPLDEDDRKDDETEQQAKLRQSNVIEASPEGFPYEFKDIRRAIQMAFEIKNIFETNYEAESTVVVYSGQGAHVYLLDNDDYHNYDEPSRRVIATDLIENHGYAIDKAVTIQDNRLLRVPYTLHSGVSRVVTPIESPDFDFKTQAKPRFLQ